MIDIDLIIYKINSSFYYIYTQINELFTNKPPEDKGYTIISKNKIKYVTFDELWED